ncbi:hypothetical protein V6N13_120485 [Hibiscus sabdariffa]
MATASRASKPGRQLGELLKEQQEPFVLEVYLSERGFVKKNLIQGVNFNFGCCHGNSAKFLNKSGSQNHSKKGSPQFPKVHQAIQRNNFFKIKGLRTKNSDGKLSVTEIDVNNHETAEADRFSSASSATMYNSCSDSDIDEPSMFADTSMSNRNPHDEREKKIQSLNGVAWKKINSIALKSNTNSPEVKKTARKVASKRLFWPKLMKVDSVLSPWLLNLLQTRPDKSSCACAGLKLHKVLLWSSSSRTSRSKRVSQQRKQPLFDCNKEPMENNHDKELKGKGKGKGFKGSGEVIPRFRCENLKGWGKRGGGESNIKQLLELDIISSTQWRDDFESQKWNMVMVVGNAIVEEITSEVVMDIMNFL